MIDADDRSRRDVPTATCLLLSSIVAAFPLFAISVLLKLRDLSTPRQEHLGSFVWALAATTLIVVPAWPALRRQSSVPRWLIISAWALFALFVLQVISILVDDLSGVLSPILLSDEWVGVVALVSSVVGVYAFSSAVAGAFYGRQRGPAVAQGACAITSGCLVLMVTWACLFLESARGLTTRSSGGTRVSRPAP